jgi:tRNA G18 (ribose-2'-O)-methylase SpoU
VPFEYTEAPDLQGLKEAGYRIVALEQSEDSIDITTYKSPEKVALLLGEEVEGVTAELLAQCDDILEIPMVGKKESFNVSVATGIALYQLSLL